MKRKVGSEVTSEGEMSNEGRVKRVDFESLQPSSEERCSSAGRFDDVYLSLRSRKKEREEGE